MTMRIACLSLSLATLMLGACAKPKSLAELSANPPDETLGQLYREAQALQPLATTKVAQEFLAATADLPKVETRIAYKIKDRREYYTESQLPSLTSAQREALDRKEWGPAMYYFTGYGSPLAYMRPYEILGQNGLTKLSGKKILDFGYGGVGPLRLLAANGATAVGVDVEPALPALYQKPEDQGKVKSRSWRSGSIKMVNGRFPAESDANKQVGGNYDLIISKNTLKKGYIHPPANVKVDPAKLIDLGVSDDTFLRVLNKLLKPHGKVMIYNICPAPAPPGQPYIPWADGHSPFTEEEWETAGFKIMAFDQDDSAAAREMGKALGWDKSDKPGDKPIDLNKEYFAWYTLVEKVSEPRAREEKPQ